MLILKNPKPFHVQEKVWQMYKQQIHKENTKHTLLARKSSQNKAQQAETYDSS